MQRLQSKLRKRRDTALKKLNLCYPRLNQPLTKGEYSKAKELAKKASSIALDIDQDGILNEEDFAPTINNNYIYTGVAVLTAIFTSAGFVFSRNRKKRMEYLAKVSEYRAKIEECKREGYDASELEEMMK